MGMHADVIAALNTENPLIFYTVEIAAVDETPLRYLDGSGFVVIGDDTFQGEDELGNIVLPEELSEGMTGISPSVDLDFHPADDDAALDVMDLLDELTFITIKGPGAINRDTGASIGTPDTVFVGYVEQAVDVLTHGGRVINIEAVGGFARFLDRGDGMTMCDASHKSVRSGEKGFEFVTGLDEPVYWGQRTPRNNSGSVGAWALPGGGSGNSGGVGMLAPSVRSLFQ